MKNDWSGWTVVGVAGEWMESQDLRIDGVIGQYLEQGQKLEGDWSGWRVDEKQMWQLNSGLSGQSQSGWRVDKEWME